MKKVKHKMAKQHHKPCGTCPFAITSTRGCDTENWQSLGYSPPERYVAQYFLPNLITCHEFVNYEDPDWFDKAADPKSGIPQCVGFAMCRAGGDVIKVMPDTLLREEHDPESGAFHDIWDFWAYHQNMTRAAALVVLDVPVILALCDQELHRVNGQLFTAAGDRLPGDVHRAHDRIMKVVAPVVFDRWQAATNDHRKEVRGRACDSDQSEGRGESDKAAGVASGDCAS